MKKTGRNDTCWCGSGRKYKVCHGQAEGRDARAGSPPPAVPLRPGRISPPRPVPPHIVRPDYAADGRPRERGGTHAILAPEHLPGMRETCRTAARILRQILAAVAPGVTTDQLDALAHEAIIAAGGYPSPLNYHGFPKSICTSVNEVICHGIPDDRPLEDGDIVNIDVTVFMNGVHGDCSAMATVGTVDEESQHLIATARESLQRGLAVIRPGARIRDIGHAIEPYARQQGCQVVRTYCGHGIGPQFHTDIVVPHHYDRTAAILIRPGMVFTVEPMINAGGWRHRLWDDGWTAVTADGRRSAQFEHTILVTEDGIEILTEEKG